MAVTLESTIHFAASAFWIWTYFASILLLLAILKTIYNVFFHPLRKHPGPLLWRASRLPASYHHASGDLYKCIADFHAKYGPTVRIAPDELSFTAPEAWTSIYNNRPQLQKAPYHFPPSDPEKMPDSMITAGDTEHARLRRLTGPGFTQNGLNEVEPVMQRYSDLLISQLTKASSEGSQNMVEWFLWTLNDVIGQLALDQEFECLKRRRMHPWPDFLLGSLKSAAALNQLRRFGLLRLAAPLIPKRIILARDTFVETATTSIKQRLEREGKSEDGKRPDFIGLMLREMKGSEKLSEAEIRANSVLLVDGGAETTSTCLSSLVYYLCKTPRVLNKLQAEIRETFGANEEITIKATMKVPYLQASIDEALRIFPVASYITPRVTPRGGHIIADEWIPGDTYVSVGQWYMGRSERFFYNPMEFRPERWLENTKDPSGRPIKDILSPFSLGPRNCLGKQMALTEARLVTAKLLWHFDMELDGAHDNWVDDARFYILWQLQPLKVRLTPVIRRGRGS